MVTRMLALPADAEPGDATDALAVALCFACLARPRARACPRDRAAPRAGSSARSRRRWSSTSAASATASTIPLSTFYRLGEPGERGHAPHPHPRARGRARPLRLPHRGGAGPLRAAHRRLRRRARSSRSSILSGIEAPDLVAALALERRRAPHAHPRRRQEDRRAPRPRAEGQDAGPRRRRRSPPPTPRPPPRRRTSSPPSCTSATRGPRPSAASTGR